jgi:hypothetical protein
MSASNGSPPAPFHSVFCDINDSAARHGISTFSPVPSAALWSFAYQLHVPLFSLIFVKTDFGHRNVITMIRRVHPAKIWRWPKFGNVRINTSSSVLPVLGAHPTPILLSPAHGHAKSRSLVGNLPHCHHAHPRCLAGRFFCCGELFALPLQTTASSFPARRHFLSFT